MVSRCRRWIAGTLAGVALTGSAWAQQPAAAPTPSPALSQDLRWTLGSATAGMPGDTDGLGVYDLNDTPGVQLQEVEEADLDLVRLGAAARSSLDGFDVLAYPVAAIEAYFDRVLDGEEAAEEEPSDFASGTLRLVVRTRAADGTVRWWRLVGDSGHLQIAFKTPAFPDDAERLAPATPDPRRPIVDVQYSSVELHASSSSDTRHHLLLDFRAAAPRVIGFFDETHGGGCGGACMVYSCIFGVGEEVGCRWDAEHDGFFCAHTYRRRDTAWMERRATSYFHFGTRKPEPPAPAASPVAGGLDPRVDRASTPSEGSTQLVDGFGVVSAITMAAVGKRAVVLVGAPSLSWHFGARLYAALTEYPRRERLTEIGSRLDIRAQPFTEGGPSVDRLEDHDHLEVAAHTPDAPPPRFVATELARIGSVTILRVLVTEGGAKGVYLVGLELIGDRLVTDAMLVATNGESHLHCNTWRVPASAVGMSVVADPFAVTLDVEPAGVRNDGPGNVDDDTPARSCRVRATVNWEPGQGFRYEAREERCGPAPARRVAIDDAGAISVAHDPSRPPL